MSNLLTYVAIVLFVIYISLTYIDLKNKYIRELAAFESNRELTLIEITSLKTTIEGWNN